MKNIVAVVALLVLSNAHADSIRPDHPFIGTWRIDIPRLSCFEIYRIRGDGTTLVTSAEEVAESTFAISDKPSEKGFYKWQDKITRDNGKKDCIGEQIAVGHEATDYVVFHPSGDQFLLCGAEDIGTCIGPFKRVNQ